MFNLNRRFQHFRFAGAMGFLIACFLVAFSFNNCGTPMRFHQDNRSQDGGELQSSKGESEGNLSCEFNGTLFLDGESTTAYLNSTVSKGETCVSESRKCINGEWSGSYQFSFCQPGREASCAFNGRTMASGTTVPAFLNSAVEVGQACTSEVRKCVNGTLSGSYAYGSCSVGGARSCLFNGKTIVDGEKVSAYFSSSVPKGQACNKEVRVCTNGVLSGSANFPICQIS